MQGVSGTTGNIGTVGSIPNTYDATKVCPHCGRCPHCGQPQPLPYWTTYMQGGMNAGPVPLFTNTALN